jgi:hypothetical protein
MARSAGESICPTSYDGREGDATARRLGRVQAGPVGGLCVQSSNRSLRAASMQLMRDHRATEIVAASVAKLEVCHVEGVP